jgi:uncharacterized membrane protein
MSLPFMLVLTFAIGLVSGLRAFTGPAAVTWAAYFGWINLSGTPMSFMGSKWALVIFTILAVVEYVTDQLPSTPARTVPMQLGARLVLGSLAGASLAAAGANFLQVGIIGYLLVGIIGAIIGVLVGTYGGYHARAGLVRNLKVPDIAVAIPEDLVAIALGLFVVSRF